LYRLYVTREVKERTKVTNTKKQAVRVTGQASVPKHQKTAPSGTKGGRR
jgi:hypothetical protein